MADVSDTSGAEGRGVRRRDTMTTSRTAYAKGLSTLNLVVMMAVVALILVGIAVAVANADAGMPDAPRDLPDIGIPVDREMKPADVDALRFSMAPRGYRMGEVDDAMARLREELAARDAEIERLRNPPSDEPPAREQLDDILEIQAGIGADPHAAASDTHG